MVLLDLLLLLFKLISNNRCWPSECKLAVPSHSTAVDFHPSSRQTSQFPKKEILPATPKCTLVVVVVVCCFFSFVVLFV